MPEPCSIPCHPVIHPIRDSDPLSALPCSAKSSSSSVCPRILDSIPWLIMRMSHSHTHRRRPGLRLTTGIASRWQMANLPQSVVLPFSAPKFLEFLVSWLSIIYNFVILKWVTAMAVLEDVCSKESGTEGRSERSDHGKGIGKDAGCAYDWNKQ